jgi:hypothetical protein
MTKGMDSVRNDTGKADIAEIFGVTRERGKISAANDHLRVDVYVTKSMRPGWCRFVLLYNEQQRVSGSRKTRVEAAINGEDDHTA